jgi:hypothetical protein
MESTFQRYKHVLMIIFYVLIFAALAIGLYYLINFVIQTYKKKSTFPNYKAIKTRQDSANTTLTNSIRTTGAPIQEIIRSIPVNQQVLANFSVLTAYNAGYAGPFTDGVYSEVTSTQLAIQQGVRGFFLNMDCDTNNRPVLVNRDAFGYRTNIDSFLMNVDTPVSILGGDPQKVLQTIADMSFSNSIGRLSNDPVIIFLYFQNTPDPKKDKGAYIQYLSKIAKMLKPLRQNHLRSTPRGDFTRQRATDTMLLFPIQEYEKKVIIYTNVDTSVFREKAYPEDQDLDYWVNMTFYTNSTMKLGVTKPLKDASLIRGHIQQVSYYKETPPDRISDLVEKTMINYNVALNQLPSIDISGATTLLDTYGCQMVPIDIFNRDNAAVVALYVKSPFRVKPAAIRYTIPEPIKIAPQNPKMNANKGLLIAPAPPVAAAPPKTQQELEKIIFNECTLATNSDSSCDNSLKTYLSNLSSQEKAEPNTISHMYTIISYLCIKNKSTNTFCSNTINNYILTIEEFLNRNQALPLDKVFSKIPLQQNKDNIDSTIKYIKDNQNTDVVTNISNKIVKLCTNQTNASCRYAMNELNKIGINRGVDAPSAKVKRGSSASLMSSVSNYF